MSAASLYDRLGQTEGIRTLVNTIAKFHLANPTVGKRFAPLLDDEEHMEKVLTHFVHFLEMGTGGPNRYAGAGMVAAHKGMNINRAEYLAVLEDVELALEELGHDQATKDEVLLMSYRLKDEIMHQ